MKTSIELNDKLRVQIEHLASIKNQHPQQLVQEILHKYLNERARKEFIQKAIDSKKHFEETGLHLTLEEVGDWMRQWGTDAETKMPPCHK